MKKVHYEGESKVIKRIVELLNLKPELGGDHENAFYGDLSKEAYDHSQTTGNPHRLTLADLGIDNIQRQIDLLMDAVGSLDFWICRDDNAEFIDHDGNNLVFVSSSNLLKWH